jgi:hypothetical protein
MNNELTWRITPLEKRKSFQQGIIIVGLMFISLFIRSLARGELDIEFQDGLYAVLSLAVSIPLLLLFNKIFPYKERAYHLSDNKVMISQGDKKKEYSWNEFDYFYSYLRVKGSLAPEILRETRETTGDIFYLRKKSKNPLSKLYKSFVIVYSESKNDKEVLNFLSRHLPRREKNITDELGLIFYEFK